MKKKEKQKKKKTTNILNIYISWSILSCLLMAIIGIIFLTKPVIASRTVEIIISILLLIHGAAAIFNYWQRKTIKMFNLNLAYGIISIVLGILIIFNPLSLVNIMTIIFGCWLVFNGLIKLNYGINLRRIKEESWLLTFIIGVFTALFGIIVILNPFINLYMTQVIGIFIIMYAVLDGTNTILFKKRAESFLNLFK